MLYQYSDVLLNVGTKIELFTVSANFEVAGTDDLIGIDFSWNYWTNHPLEKVDICEAGKHRLK